MADTARRDYLAIDLGADPSGQNDSWQPIQAALNQQLGAAGDVALPPGRYRLTRPLVVLSGLANSSDPVPYPSLFGAVSPGRIGDANDSSAVEFICDPDVFPVGEYPIQYLPPNNNVASSGFKLADLGIRCGGRGAGVLVVQPRMANVARLSIDHAADGSGSGTMVGAAATGGFVAWSVSGTAPAYNTFDHITTAYGAKDGFVHNLASNDVILQPTDLNSTRYAFNCQGSARWIAPHYEASQYGFLVVAGQAQIEIIGADIFGVPTLNAVQLQSNYSGSGPNNSAKFIGGRYAAGPTSATKTSCPVWAQGNGVLLAQFIGADLIAEGQVEYFVVSSAPTGSRIKFHGCEALGAVSNSASNFPYDDANGTIEVRDCGGINPVGSKITQPLEQNSGALTPPALPAAGSTVENLTGVDATLYIAGGSAVTVSIDGTSTGQSGGAFHIPAHSTVSLGSYTAAPTTYQWIGH